MSASYTKPGVTSAGVTSASAKTDGSPQSGSQGGSQSSFSHFDHTMMRVALKQAEYAGTQGEVPVGAVIADERTERIVSTGYNSPIAQHDPSAHAEIQAIRAAGIALQNYRLADLTLYVTLEPCVMCTGAIVQARLVRVVFGAREPKSGALCSQCTLLNPSIPPHTIQWQEGLFADEAAQHLQLFFKNRR